MSKINRHPVRRTAAGVLAGALALSGAVAGSAPAFAAPGFDLVRVQGDDRYETSAAIATAFGAASEVILASGEQGRTPDALAANFLAGVRNAPVLLTRRDTTPPSILAAIRASGATRVTLIGGTVAISDTQAASLTAAGFTVTRIGGADRYQTAALVAAAGEGATASNTGLVASGVSTIDALAGGPLAFRGRHPLLLVTRDGIPGATLAAIRANGITNVFILGGEAVVGPRVVAQLTAAGVTVNARLGGANRSETSVAIANRLISDFGFSASTFNLASGLNEGIDALGGAALSGKEGRVLLITNNAASATPVTGFATARQQTLNAAGRIFGGPTVVAATLETAVETAGAGTVAGSTTVRPELRTATIVSTTQTGQVNADNPLGTVVRYTFDEPVLSAPNPALFQLVQSNGTAVNGSTLVSVSGNSVTVRFTTINTVADSTSGAAANVNNYTLATNAADAVTDSQGQTATEGDAAVGSAASSTTTLTANTTAAPDLRSIAAFRAGSSSTTTAVDFVFDQAAFVTSGASFNLVTPTGDVLTGTGPTVSSTTAGSGTIAGGNGTTTVTVIFPNISGTTTLTAANVARAYVGAGSVADTQANATTPGTNDNPLQSVNVTGGGVTTDPDLTSASFIGRNTTGNATANDQVLYTFDQSVGTAGSLAASQFSVFFADGSSATGTVRENSSDNTRVLVDFVGAQLTDAVGASVTGQAGGGGSVRIRPASAGVAPLRPSTAARTPGSVAAPELRSVAVATATNALGVVTSTATYTFDQAIDPTSIVASRFVLYMANGNRLTGTNCDVPANATSTNTQVVCSAFTGTPITGTTFAENAAAATLGAVLADAVNGASGSDNQASNPIGAEATTGGTGTRS